MTHLALGPPRAHRRPGAWATVLAIWLVGVFVGCSSPGTEADRAGDGGAQHGTAAEAEAEGSAGGSSSDGPTSGAAASRIDFSGPGPYAVGGTSLVLSERGDRPVLVRYPLEREHGDGGTARTTRPAPHVDGRPPRVADDGPFPVVLYSHGIGGTAGIASRQLEHLASWGFVVASPEHLERNLFAATGGRIELDGREDVVDLQATLGALADEDGDHAGPLAGGIDLGKVAAIGHSAGGRAVVQLAQEGELDAWIGQAPAPPVPFSLGDLGADRSSPATLDRLHRALADQTAPDAPALIVAADGDAAIPAEMVEATYDWLPGPRRLVTLARTGHNSFTDACASLRAAAVAAGALADRIDEQRDVGPDAEGRARDLSADLIELGSDGCTADHADPDDVRDVLGHLHVAHLRAALFGTAGDVPSLDPAFLDELFPGAVAGTRADA